MGTATNPYMSTNPVFVHFGLPKKDGDVVFKVVTPSSEEGGEPTETDTDQMSASVLKALSEPNGAKMGYGIGYPEAMPQSANISWKGRDIWFADPMHNLPWGEAVLCEGAVSDGVLTLKALDSEHIHGVCYGMTEKDCSIQLNAGISIAPLKESIPVEKSDESGLYIALMANAIIDSGDGNALVLTDGHEAVIHEAGEEEGSVVEKTVEGAGSASTVVAVSEAIDPTVFNLSSDGMNFVIPKATAGYQFTVTGTLFKMPRFSRPGVRTSFKDQVSSYPTALSIVDAKTASDDGE